MGPDMKWFIHLMALGSLTIVGGADAAEPPPNCPSWWAFLKQNCGWTRPACCCPDDYQFKPLPPVACRFCPHGCDNYAFKPLPPVYCRYCPHGCDTYCYKPYPCISSNCRPWYSCGFPTWPQKGCCVEMDPQP